MATEPGEPTIPSLIRGAGISSARLSCVATRPLLSYNLLWEEERMVRIPLIVLMVLFPLAALAQSGGPTAMAGEWCAQSNAGDCLIITATTAEGVSGTFLDSGKQYALAVGYARGQRMSMAFKRVNHTDLGYVTFILRDAKTADARTFNPDGTLRWSGVYLKRR